jgi:hypothetical protein
VQLGTLSPVNGDTVPAPPEGVRAAMSDAQGPGSHVLHQDVVIPPLVPSATLSFDLFVGNRDSAFFTTPATLDFSTPTLNQQARVDIHGGGRSVQRRRVRRSVERVIVTAAGIALAWQRRRGVRVRRM